MDHAEEQDMEIQALEAIYMDDFKRLEEEDSAAAFEVTLVPETGADEDTNHVSIAMKIVYTPTYPEAAPTISVRPVRRGGLTDEAVAECEALLREASIGDELLGTPMVYALAEKAQEWLVEHNQPEMDMHTEMMARLAAEKASQGGEPSMARLAADGDEDGADEGGRSGRGGGKPLPKWQRKQRGGGGEGEGSWRKDATEEPAALRGEYTPVTPQTFAAWRAQFEARKAAAASKGAARGAASNAKAPGEERCTGRQLFERAGHEALSLIAGDAGALDDDEEDMMSAPREGAEGGAGLGGDAGGGGGGEGEGDVLDAVGDAALFDEDEDLPEDDEDEADAPVSIS